MFYFEKLKKEMENQLIKISESPGGKQVVSARELYDFLGLDRSQWARWYDKNILSNEFAMQSVDYQVFDTMSNTQGGRPSKDFEITIDFAKRLAMMVRSERGEEVRRYFIECEKKLKSITIPNFNNPAEAARAWATEYEEKQKALEEAKRLQEKVIEDAPKVEFFDDLVDRQLNLNFRTTAKEIGIKESELIAFLLEKKYLYRDNKNKLNPYAQYTGEDALFVIKEQKNEKWAGVQTLITPKGRARFNILLGRKQ